RSTGPAGGTSSRTSSSPRSASHCHGDHAVPHRWPALVRTDLGDDQGRTGFRLRRDRVGDLQAVPGRLLWPVHGGQRRAVPGGHRDHRPADQVAQSRGEILMETITPTATTGTTTSPDNRRKRNTGGLIIGIAAI